MQGLAGHSLWTALLEQQRSYGDKKEIRADLKKVKIRWFCQSVNFTLKYHFLTSSFATQSIKNPFQFVQKYLRANFFLWKGSTISVRGWPQLLTRSMALTDADTKAQSCHYQISFVRHILPCFSYSILSNDDLKGHSEKMVCSSFSSATIVSLGSQTLIFSGQQALGLFETLREKNWQKKNFKTVF